MRNLARHFIVVNEDLAVDGLFFVDTFDDVTRAHVEANGVPSIRHFVVQSFDFGEGGLESILWDEKLNQRRGSHLRIARK